MTGDYYLAHEMALVACVDPNRPSETDYSQSASITGKAVLEKVIECTNMVGDIETTILGPNLRSCRSRMNKL